MDWKQNKNKKWIAILFFILLLALGTRFFADYGISWDEPTERRSGIYSFCIIYKFFTGDTLGVDLTKWSDRYYGVGLQHILLLADYLAGFFNVHPYGNLPSWLLRHFLTCIFMICGLFFLYRTAFMLWKDHLKALLPVVLFLFIPRFVAESFYNIKDMGLLAAVMIGGYFMVRYAFHTTWQNALYLGIVTAFVCSVRLSGLQFLLAGVGTALFMDMICKGRFCYKKILLHLLCLFTGFAVCIFLFYPAGWEKGFYDFFREAIAYMAHHPWQNTIRFCGKDWHAGSQPWYYLIVWIGVTTPLPVLFLLFTGSVCVLKKYFASPLKNLQKRTMLVLLMFFLMFWGELLLLPFIVKSIYNGWRQFYFLGYPMLILACCGLISLWNIAVKNRFSRMAFIAAAAVITCFHVTWMITQHPHQYLYFNILSSDPQNDFELDYWHVSQTEALRKILTRHAHEPEPKTIAYNYTLSTAMAMLGDEEQQQFREVSRYGYYDYIIILNDNGCRNPGSNDRYPLKKPRKIISDEIRWIKNSLWTKEIMAYRIVGFEKTPGSEIKMVEY